MRVRIICSRARMLPGCLLMALALAAASCGSATLLSSSTGGGASGSTPGARRAASGRVAREWPGGAGGGSGGQRGPDAGADAGDRCAPNGTGVVGILGCPCSSSGMLACNGNAQAVNLICSQGSWILNQTCAGASLCDSRLGTCQPIDPLCSGTTAAGQNVCATSTSVTKCGPDRVFDTVGQSCSGATPTCLNGACVACAPTATQACGPCADGVETCTAEGTWGACVGALGQADLLSRRRQGWIRRSLAVHDRLRAAHPRAMSATRAIAATPTRTRIPCKQASFRRLTRAETASPWTATTTTATERTRCSSRT